MLELAAKYKDLISQVEHTRSDDLQKEESERAERAIFHDMLDICLWGNATDLSLLTSLTHNDIHKLQGAKARIANEKNILANDSPLVLKVLREAKVTKAKQDRRVDIVLDNAGFELLVDLLLAGYLLAANLATHVVLHPKSIPWFVSDVLPVDFGNLLSALANPQSFYSAIPEDDKHSGPKLPEPLSDREVDELLFLFQHWSTMHREGRLVIRPNRFWTHAGSFWRLPTVDPQLFKDLKESELVIFKGDLNYRKLTADVSYAYQDIASPNCWIQVAWDPTTLFTTAIGPLGPGSGMRTLACRTCKADVVVGLSEGDDERLRQTAGGGSDCGTRKWAWSGKWAVVQFCDGKKQA